MDYVICAPGMPFNGDTLKTKSLGGSESAAYYLARELARRGHRVTVFTGEQQEGVFEGVTYCWLGEADEQTPLGRHFEYYARNTPHDVLIVQRHPIAFANLFAAKLTIWQTHDLALHRYSGAVGAMAWNMNIVTGVSEWHTQQILSVYPIEASVVRVVPNGVDAALYAAVEHEPLVFKPDARLKLLYQSRPERGLEHLVRPGGIMDRLREVATLAVCGYANTTAEMAPYYAQLDAWMNALPNVSNHGALTKADLAKLQKASDLLIYPTEFGEVSCITAMEAMHAHLPMLTSACGALPETCRESGTELLPLKDGKADEDAFVARVQSLYDDLIDAEREQPSILAVLSERQRHAALTRTWGVAADALERVVDEEFARRTDTALVRHFIKVGSIPEARAVLARTPETNPILDRAMGEVLDMYAFLDDDTAYAAQYKAACDDYYARNTGADLRTNPFQTSRGIAVMQMLQEFMAQAKCPAPRILEYGCAAGHFTINIAKAVPAAQVHGIDIDAQSLQEALKWAAEADVPNVTFTRADSIDAGCGARMYDVIILAEVLEHVRDYRALLEQARAHLRSGGVLITTTPYGPWEWMSGELFKRERQHWQHFERTDLLELFAGMDPHVICAPAGHAPGGQAIGSWCCLVAPGQVPFGEVDLARKIAQTIPEQTVSACLIVKDGERTLRKALDSLIPWVSEVVIGVDGATRDRTNQVIQHFAEANPWLPVIRYDGAKALEVGFSTVRNSAVERASGDWILWMDADEELIGGDQIPKLLRNNTHAAYACPQIHYSIQPAQVLTTDLPSRLFRNRMGIQFHGLVHEHPELTPGEGIKSAVARHEIQFAHNGYVTEEVRRQRYIRNLPLLLKDCEESPARILNKFLLIRDLAQGIGFELQQSGGRRLASHGERAQRVIALWRELLADPKPVSRMLVDAIPYYTLAAEVLGGWFSVDTTVGVEKPPHSTKLNVQGKFLHTDDFLSLITRLSKEATANYDSSYF